MHLRVHRGTPHRHPEANSLGETEVSKGQVGAQGSLEKKCQILLSFETEEAKRRPRIMPGQAQPCPAMSCYPYAQCGVWEYVTGGPER